jgi:hypothetical protein
LFFTSAYMSDSSHHTSSRPALLQQGVSAEPSRAFRAAGRNAGLPAGFHALRHLDDFGNAAVSGSFFWKPAGEVEWGWLARQFALAGGLMALARPGSTA